MIIGKYWGAIGGIETHVKSLCFGLVERGFRVTCIAFSTDRGSRLFREQGVHVVECGVFCTLLSAPLSIVMPIICHRLWKKGRVQLIHLHLPNPTAHLSAVIANPRESMVLTWHSDIPSRPPLSSIYNVLVGNFLARATAIITSTRQLAETSKQIPKDIQEKSLHVIPFGQLLKRGYSIDNRVVTRIRSLAKDRKIVFALGRHVPYKGFHHLIRAVSDTNLFLIIGGDGPLLESHRSLAKREGVSAFFPGLIPQEELWAYYDCCHIFCLPSVSHQETFGLVQIEAMASGKPVVSFELDNGPNAVNVDQETGLVVPLGDHGKLRAALVRLSENDHLRMKLGENAKSRVEMEFSTSRMIDKHIELYGVINKSFNKKISSG